MGGFEIKLFPNQLPLIFLYTALGSSSRSRAQGLESLMSTWYLVNGTQEQFSCQIQASVTLSSSLEIPPTLPRAGLTRVLGPHQHQGKLGCSQKGLW